MGSQQAWYDRVRGPCHHQGITAARSPQTVAMTSLLMKLSELKVTEVAMELSGKRFILKIAFFEQLKISMPFNDDQDLASSQLCNMKHL